MKFFEAGEGKGDSSIFKDDFQWNEKSCLDTGLLTQKQIDTLKKQNYLEYVIKATYEIGPIGWDCWDVYATFKNKDVVTENDKYDSIFSVVNTTYKSWQNTMWEINKKYEETSDRYYNLVCGYDFDGPEYVIIYLKQIEK